MVALARTEHPPLETARADAAPMIVAHGLFGSGRNWATLAKRFAETRRVVSVDLRNHGDSPWTEEMDYPSMGADLLETVDDLGGRAVLLGHSMGGKAAMAAALARPAAVAALIVADIAPVAYAPGGEHVHDRFAAAMRAVDLAGVDRRSAADAALAGAVPDPALRAFLLQNLAVEAGADGARRARWRPNLAAIEAATPALIGWPQALTAAGGAAPFERPSLFVHGGASPYVAETGRRAIAAGFPAARVETLAGLGHWLHAEAPERFFETVSTWLAEVAP